MTSLLADPWFYAAAVPAVLLVGHLLLWAPTALFAAAWLALARSPRGSGQVAQHAEKPLAQG